MGAFYLYIRDMYNECLQKQALKKRPFLSMDVRTYSANSVTMFRITFVAANMLSSGTNSILPWKFRPPAKMFGQGGP